jgi:hypothetical protein
MVNCLCEQIFLTGNDGVGSCFMFILDWHRKSEVKTGEGEW